MKLPFSSALRERNQFAKFRALDPGLRSIVFYAEDTGSWSHFEQIIAQLTGDLGRRICYVTSDADDPVLSGRNSKILPFYIGFGAFRTALFRTLQADVLVMTMPDLETFHIKRSRYPVHYVYVHHTMVSTHMIFRATAFDHFDTVMCVGPHHKEEIRAREALYALPRKNLVEHGYGRLDSIIKSAADHEKLEPLDGDRQKRVLVAPSWGKHALLETCGARMLEILLAGGYHVTVRPHPMTIRKSRGIIADLNRRFGSSPNVEFDVDVASQKALHESDIMITDWSGVGLEYGFGLERPVLYVDVPRKVNNPDYERLSCVPIEVQCRSQIGGIVSPEALAELPRRIEAIYSGYDRFRERVRNLRARWIYNVGYSGAVGAEHIAGVAERARQKDESAGDPSDE